MLNWAKQFNIFCLLDNQGYSLPYQQYEFLLAADEATAASGSLDELDSYLQTDNWYFGHISYQLTGNLFPSAATEADKTGFPTLFFFRPNYILKVENGFLEIMADDPNAVFEQIDKQPEEMTSSEFDVSIHPSQTREDYIRTVQQLQQHIHRGDCYEINYCMEFFDARAIVDPYLLYQNLMKLSPNPYSVFYKLGDRYLVCGSPERYLKKSGKTLLSQPMKGTARRNAADSQKDEEAKESLKSSEKERAENVMVVDLVRNDLSQVCEPSTVHVRELFGIQSFPNVHQMVSTVAGAVSSDKTFGDIIKATFPMGSMTGAPKKRVVELISQYERSPRGIFSGAVGYISPDGDFDFNVVIRSIMYNSNTQYLSYQVGSGITFYSDAEKEWEECLLKAEAIKKVLT